AFALTAYDALRIAVEADEHASVYDDLAAFKRALVAAADVHSGVTGTMKLNAAGDRAYGSYDFWSVCRSKAHFVWRRTFSYVARRPGTGSIVARNRCAG